jgi:hypothetical protein
VKPNQPLDTSRDKYYLFGIRAEREEMKAASADLLAIKVHKLGWPSPKASA